MLRTSAANIPPGPKPATTGRISALACGTVYSGASYAATFLLLHFASSFSSLSTETATEYSQCISFFLRASSERFVILASFIAQVGSFSSRAALALSLSSLCPISRRRFLTSIICRASLRSRRLPTPTANYSLRSRRQRPEARPL